MTDLHDMPHPLLLEYLDGRLDAARAAEVEAWAARDPARGRLVAEHRAVWEALTLADPARGVPRASSAFSSTLVERAREEEPPARARLAASVGRIAAAVLVVVGLWAVLRPTPPRVEPLAVSSSAGEGDLVEQYGDDLDIIADYQALQAIEGQLDGVLPR